jgi:hypothetical protein
MTPTERAKRSDALYYETASVTRRVLCDMIANREADLEDAREDNAKLRELVSGLEHCCQGFACNRCPLYDQSGTNHRRCESLERELGIEVDDA